MAALRSAIPWRCLATTCISEACPLTSEKPSHRNYCPSLKKSKTTLAPRGMAPDPLFMCAFQRASQAVLYIRIAAWPRTSQNGLHAGAIHRGFQPASVLGTRGLGMRMKIAAPGPDTKQHHMISVQLAVYVTCEGHMTSV